MKSTTNFLFIGLVAIASMFGINWIYNTSSSSSKQDVFERMKNEPETEPKVVTLRNPLVMDFDGKVKHYHQGVDVKEHQPAQL
jgi:hypothetical protein